MSILFLVFFFIENRLKGHYKYRLGSLIRLFFLLPVAVLLFISMIMSIISVFDKKINIYFL